MLLSFPQRKPDGKSFWLYEKENSLAFKSKFAIFKCPKEKKVNQALESRVIWREPAKEPHSLPLTEDTHTQKKNPINSGAPSPE